MTTPELDLSEQVAPVLTGCQGWVMGERYVLKEGDNVVIGRSRDCDISLRRIGGYLERPPGERDGDHDFNTVSRRHVRLRVDGHEVLIEDLSSNGTFCDNETVERERRVDLGNGSVQLRLGTRETFTVELKSPAQLDQSSSSGDHDGQAPAKDAS